ncbi:MAG: arsenite methyltransferase [Coriobacteriales bacterium]|nr:arsenite methyltransferase [Coriobacteriales bacterium]
MHDASEIKRAVRERYADAATRDKGSATASGCGCASPSASASTSGCCGGSAAVTSLPASATAQLGYDQRDLNEIPDGADLGLGCGNPLGILELKEGETVLDLGSGGGIDCFVAAKRVGPAGLVIGVDMTPEMLDRARRNASAAGYDNVEFRLGEIEHLPVADASVDAVISNCVINLVPDKRQAFAEAFRVLRPGGRLSVSDIVTLGPLPDFVRESAEAYVACVAGALEREDYLDAIRQAGFADVRVTSESSFAEWGEQTAEEVVAQFGDAIEGGAQTVRDLAAKAQSIRVQAIKPDHG